MHRVRLFDAGSFFLLLHLVCSSLATFANTCSSRVPTRGPYAVVRDETQSLRETAGPHRKVGALLFSTPAFRRPEGDQDGSEIQAAAGRIADGLARLPQHPAHGAGRDAVPGDRL